jgi:hypothetical protein
MKQLRKGSFMFRIVLMLMLMLFAYPVLAQDSAASALEAAGCGPNEVHFEVKTDKKQHPTAQPEVGLAFTFQWSLAITICARTCRR